MRTPISEVRIKVEQYADRALSQPSKSPAHLRRGRRRAAAGMRRAYACAWRLASQLCVQQIGSQASSGAGAASACFSFTCPDDGVVAARRHVATYHAHVQPLGHTLATRGTAAAVPCRKSR